MRENGGILDRVIFSTRTGVSADLAYLDELIALNPRYSKYVPGVGYKAYVGSWEPVKNPDAIYIKIDDDVVSLGNPSGGRNSINEQNQERNQIPCKSWGQWRS